MSKITFFSKCHRLVSLLVGEGLISKIKDCVSLKRRHDLVEQILNCGLMMRRGRGVKIADIGHRLPACLAVIVQT